MAIGVYKLIRFKLKQLVAEHEFKSGKRLTLGDVASATGIHRTTLSKIANTRKYNTTTDNLDALCRFFDCQLSDLAEFVDIDE